MSRGCQTVENHEATAANGLTMQALIVGSLMALVVVATTVYVGLKTPFTLEGSIPSALLAFVLMSVLRRQFSIAENNISQTLASAAGSVGSVTAIIPALFLMGYVLDFGTMLLWVASVSLLGVFFAVPLRNQMVVAEELPFPAGTACAVTLKNLHGKVTHTLHEGRVLLASGGLAALATWFRQGIPRWIPEFSMLPFTAGSVNFSQLGFGFAWYPMLFGAGALVGMRVGTGLLVGLVAWGSAAQFVWSAEINSWPALGKWLIWPGVAMLVSAGFTSMAINWKAALRGLTGVASMSRSQGTVSFRLWAVGLTVACAVCFSTMVWFFHVPWWVALLSLPMSFLLSAVCVRVYGETGVVAVGTFSHVSQFIFGGPFSNSASTILLASGVTGAASQESADMMADLKTGHLIGADPGNQFVAQIIGAVIGVAVAVPLFFAFVSAYGIGSSQLPVPAAHMWVASTKLLTGAADTGDSTLVWRVLVGVGVGIFMMVLEQGRLKRYVPSVFGMGFALILPPIYTLSLAVGALVAAAAGWRSETVRRYTPAAASGLIAGEAIVGVLIAIAVLMGLLSAS